MGVVVGRCFHLRFRRRDNSGAQPHASFASPCLPHDMMDAMTTLEPAQALYACETALRTLFAHAYRSAYGESWLYKVTTEQQRARWAARAEDEKHRVMKGIVDIPANGLAYSEFYELVEIAENHWEPLSKALGKKASTMPLLKRFATLRNPVGHNRQLYTYEQDLCSGIAGTIRNQVTIFMSSLDEAGEYYPRIEAAWDSFGNHIEGELNSGEIAGRVNSDLVLRPGDVVTFGALGIDPQDRDLEWEFRDDVSIIQKKIAKSGKQVEFSWEVAEHSVKEHSAVHLYMRVNGSPYHRAHGFDQRVYFSYPVRPPRTTCR